MDEVNFGLIAVIISLSDFVFTIVLAILVYRFTVKSSQISVENGLKESIQSINLAAIKGERIAEYLSVYDVENYDLNDQEKQDIYYLYFELNLIRSMMSAEDTGVLQKKFVREALDERVWRIVPYRSILERMKKKNKNYTGDFLEFVTVRMDKLLQGDHK